jgi:hypothetical protein
LTPDCRAGCGACGLNCPPVPEVVGL